MVRPRVRIRYRKDQDLRFLGHHDLLRAWERLLRRADVRPAQTEGFHKRARLNFPSALAVGICGLDEVIELELENEPDLSALAASLDARAPAGLSIVSIERMPAGARFSQPRAAEYDIRIPDDRLADVAERLERWRTASLSAPAAEEPASPTQEPTSAAAPSFAAPEAGASSEDAAPAEAPTNVAATVAQAPPDRLPASVESLRLEDGALRMRLKLGEAGAVRPRELLAWLDLSDLETTGTLLQRTRVEVSG